LSPEVALFDGRQRSRTRQRFTKHALSGSGDALQAGCEIDRLAVQISIGSLGHLPKMRTAMHCKRGKAKLLRGKAEIGMQRSQRGYRKARYVEGEHHGVAHRFHDAPTMVCGNLVGLPLQ
jgi:hypothetical protein